MKITVSEKPSCLDIEVTQADGATSELIATFRHCQQSDCVCLLRNNLDSIEVEPAEDGIILHLNAKEGTVINRSQIEQCIKYTLEECHS